MKTLRIKWHYFWYKYHLSRCEERHASILGAKCSKMVRMYHIDRFLAHNRILCRLDHDLIQRHLVMMFDKAFPNATPEERELFIKKRVTPA